MNLFEGDREALVDALVALYAASPEALAVERLVRCGDPLGLDVLGRALALGGSEAEVPGRHELMVLLSDLESHPGRGSVLAAAAARHPELARVVESLRDELDRDGETRRFLAMESDVLGEFERLDRSLAEHEEEALRGADSEENRERLARRLATYANLAGLMMFQEEALEEVTGADARERWRVLRDVLHGLGRAEDEEGFATFCAGPLEESLGGERGEAIVEFLAEDAESDPLVRKACGLLFRHGMSERTWKIVQDLAAGI